VIPIGAATGVDGGMRRNAKTTFSPGDPQPDNDLTALDAPS
jgi:hypothetical protein